MYQIVFYLAINYFIIIIMTILDYFYIKHNLPRTDVNSNIYAQLYTIYYIYFIAGVFFVGAKDSSMFYISPIGILNELVVFIC